ncbi:MAG: hypothetical protein WC812_02555 [Candidatus Pacearchaeota archaeon]|jgi:hypothetical protein
MEIRENPEYLKLQEEFFRAKKEFRNSEAFKKLEISYFGQLNSQIKKIEEETKKRFLNIPEIGNEITQSLEKFKFFYDPCNMRFIVKVKEMKILGKNYNLELIASKFPIEEQDYDSLKNDKQYAHDVKMMENYLFELELHPSSRHWKNEKIEMFLKENHIFGFIAGYYKD